MPFTEGKITCIVTFEIIGNKLKEELIFLHSYSKTTLFPKQIPMAFHPLINNTSIKE